MIATLYDIHGNLPALEAVLEQVSILPVTEIVIGGDVVLGPMPQVCLERLDQLDVPCTFIMGNCDRMVLETRRGQKVMGVPDFVIEQLHWVKEQLSDDWMDRMEDWLFRKTIDTNGLGAVCFCHATPHSDTDIFSEGTPKASIIPLFDDSAERTFVVGHTHMQFDRLVGKKRIINSGSVGMPFDKIGAHWLVISDDIECCTTAYDFQGASKMIENTSYPGKTKFVENHVLNVPGKETIMESFKRVEVGSNRTVKSKSS